MKLLIGFVASFTLSLFAFADSGPSDLLKKAHEEQECSKLIMELCKDGGRKCLDSSEVQKKIPEKCADYVKCSNEFVKICTSEFKEETKDKQRLVMNCLKEKKDSFSPNCYKRFVPNGMQIDSSRELQISCRADEIKLCPKEAKDQSNDGVKNLARCMAKHQKEISEKCREAEENAVKHFEK